MFVQHILLKANRLVRSALLATLAGSLPAEVTTTDIEKVAVGYMQAFFRNDLETSVQYLGPQILEPFKDAIVVRFDASEQRAQRELLSGTRYRTANDLKEAPAGEVFVRVVQWERSKTPGFLKKAKSANVIVEKCQLISEDKYRVTLIVRVDQLPDERPTVLIGKVDTKWMVIGI